MKKTVFGLFGAFGLLSAPVAHADIVWDGKPVSAWPDLADVAEHATYAPPGYYPAPKGTVFGLTILVDFSDQPPAFTKAQTEDWLNKRGFNEGGSAGSIRDYYLDVSNGMVDFQNDVYGFYRAKHPKSHYEGGSGYSGSDELWAELVEALDPEIDFSKYDNDKNGRTEAISVVYAGPSETWGQGLWPHASGSRERRDNVTLSRYMLTQMGDRLELYVFVHESGHMLFGWPDLYGFGDYCVMGNAQSPVNPVGVNDFYRADQGWIPQIDISPSDNARYTAAPNGGGFRYVNPKRENESFFWSNVQNTGRFKSLKGSGILVLHFDYKIARNDPPNPLSLAVVEADGREDLSQTMWPKPGSAAGDFFVQGSTSALSDTTKPAAHWNDGSNSGLKLYEVSASGPSMTFAVGTGTAPTEVLDGGTPPDDGSVPMQPAAGGGAGSAGHTAPVAGSAGPSRAGASAAVSGSGSGGGGAGGMPIPAVTPPRAGAGGTAPPADTTAAESGSITASVPVAAPPTSAPSAGCAVLSSVGVESNHFAMLVLGSFSWALWRRRTTRQRVRTQSLSGPSSITSASGAEHFNDCA